MKLKNILVRHLMLLVVLGGVTWACVVDEGGEIPSFLNVLTDKNNISFEVVNLNSSSVESYQLAATKLTENLEVSISAGPFMVSKNSSEGFASSISYSPDEFDAGNQTVYVQFLPTEVGEFTAEISHTTTGLDIVPIVDIEGTSAEDPASLPNILFSDNFDYTDAVLPSTDRAADDSNPTLDGWLKVRAANKDLELDDNSLTFTGYPESGVGKSVIIDRNPDVAGGQTNLLQHNLSTQQDANFVGSYYASFLLKAEDIPTVAGGYNSPLIFASWNPANGASWWTSGLLIQNDKANDVDPDNMVFGIRNEATLELSSKTMEVGKTYLIVLKHTVTEAIPNEEVTTATSTASIFIFEEGESIDVENEPTPDYTMANVPDKYYIRSVTLFQENDNQGRYIIDGLRVTNKWEDIFK